MDRVEPPTEQSRASNGATASRPAAPLHYSIQLTDRQRMAVTGGVMLGMFLGALEATVVGTAMPTVIAELKGLNLYSWLISGYILTSTIAGPIWGRLSDLYGRRLFYLIGTGVFLIGSVLSGLAQSMEQLIIFRALQGIGAGALLPLSMTIIGEIYSLEKRARMQGIFSGVWGFASIVGPLVGGFLTDYWNWRSVFFINIPFGLASMVVLGLAMKEPKEGHRPFSLDYAGIVLMTGSISALLLGLSHAGQRIENWTAPETIGLFAAFVVLLVLFLWVETRAEHPLIPLSLFRERVMAVSSANGFFVGMAMFGSLSFIPLFVQAVIGTTATEAGSTMTPFMLSWVVAATLGGRLMLRMGYRLIAIAGVACLVVGFGLLTWLTSGSTRLDVMRDLVFAGVGMGFCLVTLTIAVQNSVPRDRLGIATSATVFFRSIGGAVGVAVMGAVMSLHLNQQLTQLVSTTTGPVAKELAELAQHPELIVSQATRVKLNPEVAHDVQGALSVALNYVFIIGLIVASLAFFVTLFLPDGRVRDQQHARR
ncbi:MFS transporter [Candidatus Acetothermia bacterium]|nr:MFS transporter [Candidatus Acetothermia bacterium]